MPEVEEHNGGRSEGKVLWHVTMSLDGFIAGPDYATRWVFEHGEPNEMAEEVIGTTGAFMWGRRSYEISRRDDEPPYGGDWTGPVFVLTHEPSEEPEDPNITFLSGDVREAVATALAAAKEKNLVVTGADVAGQCVEEGLVDEIVIHLVPVLLGDGTRFFGGQGQGRVDLERIDASQSGQLTDLRFRVVK